MITRNLDFYIWLKNEIENREWRPTDLARKSNLSDATIGRILKNERQPDIETLFSLATALNISPMNMIRTAFVFPKSENEADVSWDDWKFLISQLTKQEEKNIKQMTEVTIEARQKSERTTRVKNFKQGKVKK